MKALKETLCLPGIVKVSTEKIYGEVNGVRRSNGSLQKDWCINRSHDLPEELNFAIRGKKLGCKPG